MKKEAINHIRHMEVTLDNLLNTIYTKEELQNALSAPDTAAIRLSSKSKWIKTSDLISEDINTEKMVLFHLLWMQSIGRIVIEDIDPLCGAVLLSINFKESQVAILS